MRLLLKGGKLTKDWINVTEHCLVTAAAVEAIANGIKLSEEETSKVIKTALIHDWDKRLPKKSGDFTDNEKTQANELLKKTQVDPTLLQATDPSFSPRCVLDEYTPSLSEKLIFYVDTITEESDIKPFQERLAQAKKRWPALGQNAELNAKIADKLGAGKTYWDAVLKVTNAIQEEIFDLLKENDCDLNNAAAVPQWVKETIEKNYRQ
ncbi:hypothetical protein COU01_01510 [Candidatus Falkowbacteria bacterium CG10_big_fil_rev_8_21_14_0_10_44_15]|uniref:HD domain-containing protein n=1 Tax=Candidatus Falkowbacteria bacterium CG10_big_fil_rev_8_21_14_0_10_44_15 TaxID=1974569 RepID=A0A2H0V099_9BACT|nr:MAG: hypothetical protein COU01_01510 [Candidatus Falkowbacteria bacterium CG10_big_fil_rev_8_21_14_0_10_44_15]